MHVKEIHKPDLRNSVVTFTTLGYGDIHPLGYSRLVASIEAFIGVLFMALFVVLMNTNTLNKRLRELLAFGLKKHHFERTEKRREEWFRLTEKGRELLNHIRTIIEVAEE